MRLHGQAGDSVAIPGPGREPRGRERHPLGTCGIAGEIPQLLEFADGALGIERSGHGAYPAQKGPARQIGSDRGAWFAMVAGAVSAYPCGTK